MDIYGSISMVSNHDTDNPQLTDVELNFSVEDVNRMWKYATFALGSIIVIQLMRVSLSTKY
jgi:hypothetical protein